MAYKYRSYAFAASSRPRNQICFPRHVRAASRAANMAVPFIWWNYGFPIFTGVALAFALRTLFTKSRTRLTNDHYEGKRITSQEAKENETQRLQNEQQKLEISRLASVEKKKNIEIGGLKKEIRRRDNAGGDMARHFSLDAGTWGSEKMKMGRPIHFSLDAGTWQYENIEKRTFLGLDVEWPKGIEKILDCLEGS